jgi:trans-aconitate methyltransferase
VKPIENSKSREWDASAYHRISGPQVSWGKKVLGRVNLRGDEWVLDAGCGTGRLTADLLEALPRGRVVGVDLSQNMIRTAREHLCPARDPVVRFAVADLQQLPFQGAFDGIFSTAAFHWVPDHRQLFRSLRAALRPGGWLVAQCGGGPNLARLRQRARKLGNSPKFSPYLGNFQEPWVFSDAQTAAAMLRSAGFEQVETSVESAPTVLETAPKFSEFIRSVVFHRHMERIPTDELRAEFIGELTRQATGDEPAYELDYWRLNLSGKAAASGC